MQRDFNTVVKTIKRSEKDVDTVLKAARLRRIENGKMATEMVEAIMPYILTLVIIVAFFGLFALSIIYK